MLGCSAKQRVSLSLIYAGKGVSSIDWRRGMNENRKFCCLFNQIRRSSHNIGISLPIHDRRCVIFNGLGWGVDWNSVALLLYTNMG